MIEQKLTDLIQIKKEAIWIKSSQEKEIVPTVINILSNNNISNIYTWSVLKTVEKIKINNITGSYVKESIEEPINSPLAFLNFYNNIQIKSEPCAFIFRDYDDCMELNHMYKRMIKEITEQKNYSYVPMIFISSKFEVPVDLIDTFSLIEQTPPSESEIELLLTHYECNRDKTIENKQQVIKYLRGFYFREIIELLDLSFYKYNKVDISMLKNKKIELVNKTNLLSYEIPTVTMKDIGGNKRFKKWYEEIKYCFNKDIDKYGVDAPKGYLALGIPGSSKTLGAKAIANDLQVPFLELDMSKILSSRVGESEQRVSRAIELIEACAPCVLLIDEVEKCLGGKQINRRITVINK